MSEPSWMNGPPRRIILATDLSARCDRALDRAAALASAWQAELIALHAREPVEDFYALSQERRLPSWRRPADATRIAEDQLRNDMMAVPATSP
jgi:nucleotide-binding universal stress UspA family protein